MFMKKLIYLFSLCLLLVSCGHKMQTQPSPASLVNPLMGTSSTFAFSHGNTYPAVAVPWGMNFWSPQTGENGSGWVPSDTPAQPMDKRLCYIFHHAATG